jgi:hypothetical protein
MQGAFCSCARWYGQISELIGFFEPVTICYDAEEEKKWDGTESVPIGFLLQSTEQKQNSAVRRIMD